MQTSRKAQIAPPQQHYNSVSNTDEAPNEELLKLLANKKKELEDVTQVNRTSEDIALYFKNLANSVGELTKGTKDMADIIKSWDDTFMIMGLTTKETKKKKEFFRFVRE
ncbi:hypothetical protein K501DRAFT_328525 [Backusella circina FSU 941]|nr:hypothetical protein K501DRAFT_328525 [Backusella circina FSU 941]